MSTDLNYQQVRFPFNHLTNAFVCDTTVSPSHYTCAVRLDYRKLPTSWLYNSCQLVWSWAHRKLQIPGLSRPGHILSLLQHINTLFYHLTTRGSVMTVKIQCWEHYYFLCLLFHTGTYWVFFWVLSRFKGYTIV